MYSVVINTVLDFPKNVPDLQVFLRNAKANDNPARAPSFAKLSTGLGVRILSTVSSSDLELHIVFFLILDPSILLLERASNIRSEMMSRFCIRMEDTVQCAA